MSAVTLTFFSQILLFSPSADAGEWESYYEKDGVTVSKMSVEGSKLIAFKGETVYNKPMGAIMHVLLDNDHRTEWVDRLYENRILERHGPFDYVLYQAFDLPLTFASRDYVYHGVASRDDGTGVVTLQLNSVEHPDAPETVGVRAELVNSRYVLTPLDDGTKTRVEVEIQTDPKGWMPAWLVNMVQKDWPVTTLNGIRGQFDKPHAGVHPLPGEETAEVADDAAAEDEAAPADAEEGTEAEGDAGAEGEAGTEGEAGAEGEASAEGEATEDDSSEAAEAPESE